MKIRVLGMTLVPSTAENSVYMVEYTRDERGGHILLPTAGSCLRKLIRLPSIVNANSAT